MKKPTFDRKRPLSWSAISSFSYDAEQWYRKYVLNQEDPPSKEMIFGSYVDKKLQEDPTYLPHVERYPIMQHAMKAMLGNIPLIGYADGFDRPQLRLKDDKTGKKAWDQKRADETGQLTLYALFLWLTEKIKPESMRFFINWMPTKEGGDFQISFRDEPMIPVLIETRRTMNDILNFGMRINDTYKQMDEYCKNHV